jgi:hypothetical protein
VEETDVKPAIAAVALAVALVAGLTACGGADSTSTLPTFTGGSSPSTTATTAPAMTPPTTATATGPAALAAHSTYTYGDLVVVVNLPEEIPRVSLPSLRLFSEFLQSAGKTLAGNKADPQLGRLASPQIAKYLTGGMDPKADHSAGSLTFTVTKIQPAGTHFVTISGCMDQSKAFPMDSAGKRIAHSTQNPILAIKGEVSESGQIARVSGFAFAKGSCS